MSLQINIERDNIDPFLLVKHDLANTKEYALDNILRTKYKQLEDAAFYNL